MKTCIVALSLILAASLHAQKWQNLCFKNPASPVCQNHEFEAKSPAPKKEATPQSVVTSPYTPASRTAEATLIVVGGIDWRFADPFADALAGINVNGLSSSTLARSLIVQLGALHGRSEADIKKILDGLSGIDQVAVSLRDKKVVVMVTGRVTESTAPAPEAGMKVVPVSGNTMLIGHADAVDQAVQRLSVKGTPSDWMRLAEDRQASSEFWAQGSARLLGERAAGMAMKQFVLTVSVRNRLSSDLAFEFLRAPDARALEMWQTGLGATTVDGNTVHVRTSIEAADMQQKFGQIAAGPMGEQLAGLLDAARYLPVRDTTRPKQTRPVIYGLDDGPKVVGQDSK